MTDAPKPHAPAKKPEPAKKKPTQHEPRALYQLPFRTPEMRALALLLGKGSNKPGEVRNAIRKAMDK